MPRGSGPLTRALVATLLLGTGLTACVPFGTDQGPTRRPPSSPTVLATGGASASGSQSPTPAASATSTALPASGPLPDGVAPVRPAALDQPPTLDGAKAVAVYFLLLYSYAYQTGDLGAWNELSHPECVFCRSVREKSKLEQARGQHLIGGAVVVEKVEGIETNPGAFYDLTLTFRQRPSRTVDGIGTNVAQTKGGDVTANVIAIIDQSGWQIREVSSRPRGSA